jgi:hypothetical protein
MLVNREIMLRRIVALFAIAAVIALSGCAVNRATAISDPSTNWSSIKSLHVVQTPGEDGSIRKLITDKLKSHGFAVTSDPESNPGADARVTYIDRWMWDITMYLLELTIVFRDPKSDYPLATGNSYHTSLTRKSAPDMVDEVVNNILATRK